MSSIKFKKYGCGCVGFDAACWRGNRLMNEGDVLVVIVRSCDEDSRHTVRWELEEDVVLGIRPMVKAHIEGAVELSEEESETWFLRVQKQLNEGATFRDVKSLMGIREEKK